MSSLLSTGDPSFSLLNRLQPAIEQYLSESSSSAVLTSVFSILLLVMYPRSVCRYESTVLSYDVALSVQLTSQQPTAIRQQWLAWCVWYCVLLLHGHDEYNWVRQRDKFILSSDFKILIIIVIIVHLGQRRVLGDDLPRSGRFASGALSLGSRSVNRHEMKNL